MTDLSFRNETPVGGPCCAAPDCDNPIVHTTTGRPARYCSNACRTRAHRRRHTSIPTVAEVAMGSASSRGRRPANAWLVHLRRGDSSVVVAIGLRRPAADRLAQQINDLLDEPRI
jgi:hypothetical protein